MDDGVLLDDKEVVCISCDSKLPRCYVFFENTSAGAR